MSDSPKKFHFMCAGEVIFTAPETEGLHSMRLNALVSNDKDVIPVYLLGRMQQGLQFQFRQRMQDPKLLVHDVVILNIVRLGEMTKEELHQNLEEAAPIPEHGGHLNG